MNWQIIFETLGTSVLLVGVVTFLGKTLMNQLLSKEVEKFKNDLKICQIEHQIRYSNLYERIALVIHDFYEKLVIAEYALKDYIKEFVPTGDLSEEERGQKACNTFNDMSKFYWINALYFKVELCEMIETFISEYKSIILEFQYKNITEESPTKKWVELNKKLESDIKDLKVKVEESFRKEIGLIK